MNRAVFSQFIWLSCLVIGIASSQGALALTAQERQAKEARIKVLEEENRSLETSMAAAIELLRKDKNRGWMATDCPFIKAGATFRAPKDGRRWTIVDWDAAVDKSNKTAEEKQALKARARAISNREAELCQTNQTYLAYKAGAEKLEQNRKEIAALRAELKASPPPPPPGPQAGWAGRWVSPIGSKFEITIQGNKFICKGEIHSYFVDELTIFSKDECDWNGSTPTNCRYTQNENGEIVWNSEGESRFEMRNGVLIRSAKASGSVNVTFTKSFEENFSPAYLADHKKRVLETVNKKIKAEEFHLKRR